MSIRWDGSVAICCNDWRGTYKAGNVVEDGLVEVWNSAAMDAARRKLYHGMRDFGPCKGCNATSYRVGLLPDKMGKVDLPKPTPRDRDLINRALAGKPYTVAVLRPWEGRPLTGAKSAMVIKDDI
jgi:radical SAM protein with 4Fe4S-binding SPASM domain